MKIFSAAQVKQWDQYTIQQEPISSINLMEKAGLACTKWLMEHFDSSAIFLVFCGSGNNGGDGFAIARLLSKAGCNVKVFCLAADKRSADNAANFARLSKLNIVTEEIATEQNFPEIPFEAVVIEALFGTGLNKPPAGLVEKLVHHINSSKANIISIDLPAGLFADTTSIGNSIIKATHTLSFGANKMAFLVTENADFIGDVHILDIGLDKAYYDQTISNFFLVDSKIIQAVYKPRNKAGHKYSYGHALLYAGSKNMMGAAILCARACLRSGAGLVTLHIKKELMHVLQIAMPEAISSSKNDAASLQAKKAAIGIGPGLKIDDENSASLEKILLTWQGPLVIDAAALKLLKPHLAELANRTTNQLILTPHTGEFEKLFGKTDNDFERIQLALQKAAQHNCYIILKGPHTLVACPDGEAYFNSTGNNGMATAGSGDVLTGILTGLLAQGYTAKQAAIFGVYLHGLAGDFAASELSEEAMLAGDITANLGKAYQAIHKKAPHKLCDAKI